MPFATTRDIFSFRPRHIYLTRVRHYNEIQLLGNLHSGKSAGEIESKPRGEYQACEGAENCFIGSLVSTCLKIDHHLKMEYARYVIARMFCSFDPGIVSHAACAYFGAFPAIFVDRGSRFRFVKVDEPQNIKWP